MTDTMYLARLEAAVLESWWRINEHGFGCNLCMGKYAATEKRFTHHPDCLVPSLLEKYPESAD